MQIKVLGQARKRLYEVVERVSRTSGSQAATALLAAIDAKWLLLYQHPLAGSPELYLPHPTRLYRKLVVSKRLKIIYYVEGDTVYVTDFFDTRQDPGRMQA